MKAFQIVLCIALLTCCSFGQGGKANGQVRKAKAAIRIGRAELIRRYGRRVINTEQPVSAKLENGMWTVSTPQWCQEMLPTQSFYCQGGHWVQISSNDGRVVGAGAFPDLTQ